MNPAFGRNWLSRRERIVATIIWNPAFLMFCIFATLISQFWHFICTFVTFWHFLLQKNYVSCVMNHMSHVTCHMSPSTKANRYRPSPAESPIIHSRLVLDPKKNFVKMVVTNTRTWQHGPEGVASEKMKLLASHGMKDSYWGEFFWESPENCLEHHHRSES